MSPVATDILDADMKTLRDAVHGLDVRLATVEGKVTMLISIARWAATALITLGVTGVTSALIWYGSVNARLDHLARDVGEVRKGLADVNVEIKGLARSIDRLVAQGEAKGE